MKAKELRIGNIVQTTDNLTVEVTGVNSNGTVNIKGQKMEADINIEDLKPFKLTPELFLKNGFDKEWHYFIKNGIKIIPDGEQYCFLFGEEEQVKIEYLHELQNIYLDLTGEEIEFK